LQRKKKERKKKEKRKTERIFIIYHTLKVIIYINPMVEKGFKQPPLNKAIYKLC
jgi:hypothetical protein